MDRDSTIRMVMVMVLGIAIIMAWQHFFPQQAPQKEPAKPADAQSTPADQTPPPPDGQTPPEKTGPAFTFEDPPAEDIYDADKPTLGDASYQGPYVMAVHLTVEGAGIRKLALADYFRTVKDKNRPADQREKFQLVQADKGAPAMVVTRMEVSDRAGTKYVVEDGLGAAHWRPVEAAANEAKFQLDVHKDGQPFLRAVKTLRIQPRGEWTERFGDGRAFALNLALEFRDLTAERNLKTVAFTTRGAEVLIQEETRGDGRMAVAGFAAGRGEDAQFKGAGDAGNEGKRDFKGMPDWAGVVNKYFALVAAADPAVPATRFASARAYVAKDADTDTPGILMTSIETAFDDADYRASVACLVFAGPKDPDLLGKPLYDQRGLMQLVQWSRGCCCCGNVPGLNTVIENLAKLMVWAIDKISLLVVNKGLAVIILVILVRLVMLPITRFSQLSMLKMQDLQPELARLKEELKGDKQQLQMAQMKLMRERGVNPMMGCLPMMLQLPIWIALYTGISVAMSLRHAPFMLWIDDLSRPDALWAFPVVHAWPLSWIGDFMGWQLNVLPMLMFVAFLLQMKYQPQAAAATPEAQTQQKMMKYMMPGMMLFFFYGAPSALNLYIMTSSLIGFFEGKYIRWHHAQIKARPPTTRPPKRKGFFARWLEAKMEDAKRLQQRAKKSDNPWEGSRRKKKQ